MSALKKIRGPFYIHTDTPDDFVVEYDRINIDGIIKRLNEKYEKLYKETGSPRGNVMIGMLAFSMPGKQKITIYTSLSSYIEIYADKIPGLLKEAKYHKLVLNNPDVVKVKVFHHNEFSYHFVIKKNGITLFIEEEFQGSTNKKLNEVGINLDVFDTTDKGIGKIIIVKNIQAQDYVKLNDNLDLFPSTKGIFDLSEMEYYLSTSPELATKLMDENIINFIEFFDLVKDEPSYQDIIVKYSNRFIHFVKQQKMEYIYRDKVKEITQKLSEIQIGTKSVKNKDEIINLLNLLFVNPEQNQGYINNIFAEKIVGLPLGQTLPVNIKLTSESLYELGKYISTLIKNKK